MRQLYHIKFEALVRDKQIELCAILCITSFKLSVQVPLRLDSNINAFFCVSHVSKKEVVHNWRLWAAFVTVLCSVDNSVQIIYKYVYSVVYW